MVDLAIVDYGAGNVRSVQKAFEHLGYQAKVTSDPKTIKSASALIFPGQGASPPAMRALTQKKLVSVIQDFILAGKPFFGVCLGLQLLMNISEEGLVDCLGVLPGTVKRLPENLKVPHMGWNSISLSRSHPVFHGVPQNSYFYFVHSYYAVPEDQSVVLGSSNYGVEFCSVAAEKALIATQFHPEKSGHTGLKLYDNFMRYVVLQKPLLEAE